MSGARRVNPDFSAVFSADVDRACLFDGAGEYVYIDSDIFPDALVEAIRSWNDDYQWVIPLSGEERRAPAVLAAISDLDRGGLKLAGLIAEALGGADVQYYSEGLWRRL